MNPAERYTDDRLDDRFSTIHHELRAVRDLPMAMVDLKAELKHVLERVDRCNAAISALRKEVESDREEAREEREAARLERKTDRRWVVGTGLSSAALVIAAVGLLAEKI